MKSDKMIEPYKVIHVGVAYKNVGDPENIPGNEWIKFPQVEQERSACMIKTQIQIGITEGARRPFKGKGKLQGSLIISRLRWCEQHGRPLTIQDHDIIIFRR